MNLWPFFYFVCLFVLQLMFFCLHSFYVTFFLCILNGLIFWSAPVLSCLFQCYLWVYWVYWVFLDLSVVFVVFFAFAFAFAFLILYFYFYFFFASAKPHDTIYIFDCGEVLLWCYYCYFCCFFVFLYCEMIVYVK